MKLGYARVSTNDQNPQSQIDELTRYGCDKIFVKHASGAKAERPELTKLIEFARDGDTIVVWKLDRLARSLKQLIKTVEHLEDRQIGFISLTESMDTTTPGGKLIFHVFGALAEFERGIITERTKAGLKAAKARGRLGGRPPAISPDDINVAQAMLSDPAISFAEVARRLGVSSSTLYRHIPGGRESVAGLIDQ